MFLSNYSKHVSCEFDQFIVDTHLCKLRDTLSLVCPADVVRVSGHIHQVVIVLAATRTSFIPRHVVHDLRLVWFSGELGGGLVGHF